MAAEQVLYVHSSRCFLLEKQTNIVSTIITFLLSLASPQGDTTPLLFHLDSSSGFVSRFLVNPSYIHIRNLFQALVSFFSSLFYVFFLPSRVATFPFFSSCWTYSHHCQIADKKPSKGSRNGEFRGVGMCVGWISTTRFCVVGFHVPH